MNRNILFISISLIFGLIISFYYIKKINNKFIIIFLIVSVILYILFSFLRNDKESFSNDVQNSKNKIISNITSILLDYEDDILKYGKYIYNSQNYEEFNKNLLKFLNNLDNNFNNKLLYHKLIEIIPGSILLQIKTFIKQSISLLNIKKDGKYNDLLNNFNKLSSQLINNINSNDLLLENISILNLSLKNYIITLLNSYNQYINGYYNEKNEKMNLNMYKLKNLNIISNIVNSIQKKKNNY